MNSMKRIFLVVMAAVLFSLTAMSVYGAPSPSGDDYQVIYTEDGVEVKLWKMPKYVDTLPDDVRQMYQFMIDMAATGAMDVYIGVVPDGKLKGQVLILTRAPQMASIYDSENRGAMAEAVEEVSENEGQLDELTPEIEVKAAEAGVPIDECQVSEVFDITYYEKHGEWEKSDNHGVIEAHLSEDSLENFVGLMHRDKGEWEVVPDARVEGENKDTLVFSADSLSPFAVVVWNAGGLGTSGKKAPKTGDNTHIWLGTAAAAVVLLSAAAYVLIASSKKKREE